MISLKYPYDSGKISLSNRYWYNIWYQGSDRTLKLFLQYKDTVFCTNKYRVICTFKYRVICTNKYNVICTFKPRVICTNKYKVICTRGGWKIDFSPHLFGHLGKVAVGYKEKIVSSLDYFRSTKNLSKVAEGPFMKKGLFCL